MNILASLCFFNFDHLRVLEALMKSFKLSVLLFYPSIFIFVLFYVNCVVLCIVCV